jgi:tocopherol O-methyltransferase
LSPFQRSSRGVAGYYDGNTRSFLRFGRRSGVTGAIHRELRAPGVSSHEEALHYVHHRLADLFTEVLPPGATRHRIADLGCGVGGSMIYLRSLFPGEYIGLTISDVQARIGRERIAASVPVPEDISIRRGSFDDPAVLASLDTLDGAYMIESFVHSDGAARLLHNLAGQIRPGGLLVLCDDFPAAHLPEETLRLQGEFRTGWHINTYLPVPEVARLAADAGFSPYRDIDLSEWVVVDRFRDLLVRCVAPLAGRSGFTSPWWLNLRGGNALQLLEKGGFMEYHLLAFRRN